MTENPYEVAMPDDEQYEPSNDPLRFAEAGNGKRFLNYLIDLFLLGFVIPVIAGVFMVLSGNEMLLEDDLMLNLISLGLYFGYYLVFESLFGLTIAKLITGTRVVESSWNKKPTFGRVFIRTLCRFIPFEPLSFLASEPGGWHDRLSKTKVVDIRAAKVLAPDPDLVL